MKAKRKDYRVAQKQILNLNCEELHWALVELIWDDYWAAFKKHSKLEDSEKAKIFVAGLTKGQRALVAVRVLDNMVRINGWASVIRNLAFCVDVFHSEIQAAYRLLGAKEFAELFEHVVAIYNKRISALELIKQEIREIAEKRKRFNIRPRTKVFADDSRRFWELADRQEKLTSSLVRERQSWRDEFIALADSPKIRIEILIETYVQSHPKEFFQN